MYSRRPLPYARRAVYTRVFGPPSRKRKASGALALARAGKVPRPLAGYGRTGGYYRFGAGRASRANVELKFLDTSITNANIPTAMTATNLCVVPQGDGESERIGRKITIRALHIRGAIIMDNQTSGGAGQYVIWRVVVDTQTNGAAFAGTDLLEADNGFSFLNLANRGRFRVLKEGRMMLQCTGGAPSGAAFILSGVARTLECHVRLNLPIEYDNTGATGAVATQRSNSLWFITNADVGTNQVQLEGGARIRYSDF